MTSVANVEARWRAEAEQLALRLDDVRWAGDRCLIVEADDPFAYVQFAFEDEGTIYGEAVSNEFLVGPDRLGPGDELHLRKLGWLPPLAEPASCPCHTLVPNWHRRWRVDRLSRIVADVALVTLRMVYGVGAPDRLRYNEVEAVS